MPRTELYGPVITWSPALRPDSTSKYLSPAMPILIGTNSALAVADDEHAFGFLARLARLELRRRGGRFDAASRLRLSVRGSFTIWPLAS